MVEASGLRPRELAPGEKLTIKREIGRGGFACCYKGTWTQTGLSEPRTVALKVLLPQYCSPSNLYRKHFMEEAALLRSIVHVNIVSCHDLLSLPPGFAGLKDTYAQPTLAMILEYVQDGTLQGLLQDQLIQPHRSLYDLGQAFSMVIDIADAISHLHRLSPIVVHRDIKLENMLLTRAGDKECFSVKVADLGLHSRLDSSKKQAMLPATPERTNGHTNGIHGSGEKVYNLTFETGSPMYMAPEVYTHKPYNEKADVFSFAVIMYEVFGRTLLVFTHIGPGKGRLGTTDQYVDAVARSGWRPSKPNALGTELWRLIDACWQEDPCRRPCMADVLDQLNSLKEAFAPKLESKRSWSTRIMGKLMP